MSKRRPARTRVISTYVPDLADYPVVLYPGVDYGRAIEILIRLADPYARVSIPFTDHEIPVELRYRGNESWYEAAGELAGAIGTRLHMIADVWVLAPCCGHRLAHPEA